ncbi:MAG TPA: hypothetical protein VNT58_04175 [Gaiellaceae bacterium]|nr:hypothetical protein [Gaiellaceae bacterium]
MEAPTLSHDAARFTHEERLARSLRAYAASRAARSTWRLRPDPCPLVALAHWIASRRRPAAPVAS